MRKHLQWATLLFSANSLQLIRVFPLVNTADSIYVICRSLVQAHSNGSCLRITFPPIKNNIRPDKGSQACVLRTQIYMFLQIILFILRGRRGKRFLNCYVFHFIACGGSFNSTSGEINVMSTYSRYSRYSRYCNWEIQSPSMNSSILLVVEHFLLRSCW